jgi:hypothetical protein
LRTQGIGTGLEQSATIVSLAQTPEQTGLPRLQYTRWYRSTAMRCAHTSRQWTNTAHLSIQLREHADTRTRRCDQRTALSRCTL